MNREKIRNDFPILQEKINGNTLIYFDNAATTQKPRQVIDKVVNFYEKENANVHRSAHTLAQKASKSYEDVRKIVANHINAKVEEIVFTKGTTESQNIIIHGLMQKLKQGDEILLSKMEHHANLVPWIVAAQKNNITIKYIPITDEYRIDLQNLQNIISEKTKIIAITHVSNVLGVINPIKEIIQMARKVNALTIIDGAQAVAHMTIDVKDLDCDFYTFSSHKICGPTGAGVLFGKKDLLEKLPPLLYGGAMIEDVAYDNITLAKSPYKFEAGTPNIAQVIGMGAAIKYLEQIGFQKIAEYDKELTAYMLSKLQEIKDVTIIGPNTIEKRVPIFSFIIKNVHEQDICAFLDREAIAVRSGHHCTMPMHKNFNIQGSIRASLYFYNTQKEIDIFIEKLKKIITICKGE